MNVGICLRNFSFILACVAAASAQQPRLTATASAAAVPKEPFLTNNGLIPTPAQYKGPMFKLSHAWPSAPLPPIQSPPWSKAINGGLINVQNASAYTQALKNYVTPTARKLLLDANFDAAAAHWYTEPWLGVKRESIHGTYPAGQFGPSIFPDTGLKTTFDTHVLTYYDERAAYTLYKVWGAAAMNPDIKTENFQFPEGSVVVKAALFVSDDPARPAELVAGNSRGRRMAALHLASIAKRPTQPACRYSGICDAVRHYRERFHRCAETGWVFTTLVYDSRARGDAWDKMVPLGAQWGNDPQANSALKPAPRLTETWINPAAPLYSTETLGWGGRLSGPNDGGRNDIQVGTQVLKNEPDSGCMSCHSPAEYSPVQHGATSFLLPSFSNPTPPPPIKMCGPETICSPAPGSADWMRWFQNRTGSQPFDAGNIAMDFDMVFSFKSFPLWWQATGTPGAVAPFSTGMLRNGRPAPRLYNEYTGAPLKKQ